MVENREHRDALARMSGVVKYMKEENGEVDTERLGESFNRVLDEAGVESDVIRIE